MNHDYLPSGITGLTTRLDPCRVCGLPEANRRHRDDEPDHPSDAARDVTEPVHEREERR